MAAPSMAVTTRARLAGAAGTYFLCIGVAGSQFPSDPASRLLIPIPRVELDATRALGQAALGLCDRIDRWLVAL